MTYSNVKPVVGETDRSAHGASVSLTSLVKQYGKDMKPAVQGINLEVKSGEFVTLLGPSGSGKTTTLMMIAGFESVTSGDIVVDGQSITDLAAHKRDIGVVFQSYALFPHMTVRDNIEFPLKMRRWPSDDIDRAVAESLELVRLTQFADRFPSQLSGGQQQRVALARATVFTPKLLLMDEPLSALDRQLRQVMQFEIKQIQRSLGITVIAVTHDQEEALTMSDLVVVMNDGKIIQAGAADEIYEQPSTDFVAEFIGETNLVRGRVTGNKATGSSVKLDSGAVVTTAAQLKAGSRVALSIRPEHIGISNGQIPSGDSNVFQADVMDWVYSGATSRGIVRLGELQLVVRVSQAAQLRDNKVDIHIDPAHIIAVQQNNSENAKS
ncbi:ABC transporter ATP-binding protein [Limibacillus sp. MBR-115]|jgi:spermidine/putrescine ABC transporter ATP-binding subunit|uniref:ABC transporter ATP-binding protein n=1 Tax=Limibacillus sp. MBR-115 TaxID=3156465 RepID=UPI0033912694